MTNKTDNYQRILTVALQLLQTKGYNAFSYRDLAEQVGIKTSSIHYHFPTKADLGEAVIKHHIDELCAQLDKLINDTHHSCAEKLTLFFDSIFASTYHAERKMCLGGMLASDVLTLPENMLRQVRLFFDQLEHWLVQLLQQGIRQREFVKIKDIKQEVAGILSTLEGALLLARLYQDEKRLALIKESIVLQLSTA